MAKGGSQTHEKEHPDAKTIKESTVDYPTAFEKDDYSTIKAFLTEFYPATDKPQIPPPPLSCLSLQGGGAKGAAYPGCAEALEENGYFEEIKVVAGASAGAISAFILGLGFSAEQFKHLSKNVNFLDYTDLESKGWGALFNGYKVGVGLDFLHYGAAFKGEGFHHFAASMVEQVLGDPNATFADLHEMMKQDPTLKEMVFKGTRYNAVSGSRIEQTFSFEETPNVRIADAVRASMAFPAAFAPWPVKDKQGKIFGIFADGGILNNNPIDVFNQQAYYDSKYLPKEKRDQRGIIHQINPSSVSLSLTSLEDLKEEITPFSDRIRVKRSEQEKTGKVKKRKEVKNKNDQWHFNDLLKVILWNQVGTPVREEKEEKQALYSEQTVQIYPEEVGTLEFDASAEKLDKLFKSGKNAMQLWLENFRDLNKPYPYPDNFDDTLSPKEKLRKKANPEEFYHQKLVGYFSEINDEMKKLQTQGKDDAQGLYNNIRLRYLTHEINKLTGKMGKKESLNKTPEEILEKAFKTACHQIKDKEALIQQNRQKRWGLIRDDEFIEHISEKIVKCINEKTPSSQQEVLRLMRGQLSNIIPLLRAKKGGNLLSLLLQTGDPTLTKEAFSIINDALAQCYYQGRKEDIKYSLAKMLNETTSPSVPVVMGMLGTPEMVKLVLDYGADPLLVDKQTGRNMFQEMISQQNYTGFQALIEHCKKNKTSMHDLRFGNQPLGHYLINHAESDFLQKLKENPDIMKEVFNFQAVNASQNKLIEETARIASSPQDLRWQVVAKQSKQGELNFSEIKKQAQDNHAAQNSKWMVANQTLKTIMEGSHATIINNLKPQDCLNILSLPSSKICATKLFELAQDPSKADILIELCKKAESTSKTAKQLQALFQEKVNGKTILYHAGEHGNAKLITYLRKSNYGMDVNHAGPLKEPCALLHAAKCGQSDAVIALIQSSSWGFRVGHQPISRRVTDDPEKRTALHYLAMNGTPSAFCTVLFGPRGKSSPTKVTTLKDKAGKTPLSYIIEHNRMDILKETLENAKGKNKGYLFNSDYYFADIFGWETNTEYADLELAKRMNPEMYHFICENLSADKKKTLHIINQVETNVALEVTQEDKKFLVQSEELAKLELSLMGESVYDDWVLAEEKDLYSKKMSFADRERFSENTNNAKKDKTVDIDKAKIDHRAKKV